MNLEFAGKSIESKRRGSLGFAAQMPERCMAHETSKCGANAPLPTLAPLSIARTISSEASATKTIFLGPALSRVETSRHWTGFRDHAILAKI
jgi:hypothetical protein